MSALETLTASRSWRATPWDYNSTIGLRFSIDGLGDASFGYGQTIYAIIKCRFAIPQPGVLMLAYLDSPAYQRFRGFTPAATHGKREIPFELTKGEVSGVEANAGPFSYQWTLKLDRSPFPEELTLPAEPPLVYYGHKDEAKQSA